MTFFDALMWTGNGFTAVGVIVLMRGGDPPLWQGLYAVGFWCGFVASVAEADRFSTALDGLLAVVYTYLWWRNRKNRRRKPAERTLGAKSKARIQALVEQMTPSPIPSPGGAS